MKTLIVGSGSIKSELMLLNEIKKSDYIICADGGAKYLAKLNVTPDVLIGDFDSIPEKLLSDLKRKEINIITYPKDKDYTDTELAIEYAIEKGASLICLVGVIGTRIDHTLANIFLLNKIIDNNINGVIKDENNEIYITDKEIKIMNKTGYKLSIIPATDEAYGITTKGLLYPLNNAEMKKGIGLGISNEFTDNEAIISVQKGRIYVMISKD